MPTCLDGRSMRCCKRAQLYLHFAYLPRECHALLRPPAVGLDQRPTAHAVVDGALTEVSSVCFVLFRAGVVALSLSRVVSFATFALVPTSTGAWPKDIASRADSERTRAATTRQKGPYM